MILFYVFFELTLIPAFFLIGRWGVGSGRRDAARKFFLYTLAGSLLTLVGVDRRRADQPEPATTGQITFSLPDLMANVQHGHAASVRTRVARGQAREAGRRSRTTQFWLFLALMAGFMVKVPIWPFHTWLPVGVRRSADRRHDAAVGAAREARHVRHPAVRAAAHAGRGPRVRPAGGRHARGVRHRLRGALRLRPEGHEAADRVQLRVAPRVPGAGLFAFNAEGLSGAVLHMVNHGLTTGALFALLGVPRRPLPHDARCRSSAG